MVSAFSAPFDETGTSRNPRWGSNIRLILDPQRPHSQNCAVWRSGFSSKGAAVSSLAAIEIDTISNWNRRPSAKECKGAQQLGFAQYASMRTSRSRNRVMGGNPNCLPISKCLGTLAAARQDANTVSTVFFCCRCRGPYVAGVQLSSLGCNLRYRRTGEGKRECDDLI